MNDEINRSNGEKSMASNQEKSLPSNLIQKSDPLSRNQVEVQNTEFMPTGYQGQNAATYDVENLDMVEVDNNEIGKVDQVQMRSKSNNNS